MHASRPLEHNDAPVKILEGRIQIKLEKRWKYRWCSVHLNGNAVDSFKLNLYKDNERTAKKKLKEVVEVSDLCGLITNLRMDEIENIIAVICCKKTVLISLKTWQTMVQWTSKLRDVLGSEQQFSVQIPSLKKHNNKSSDSMSPAILLFKNPKFKNPRVALAWNQPPQLLGSWTLEEIKAYNPINGHRFYFEDFNGFRFDLHCDDSHVIKRAFDDSWREKSRSICSVPPRIPPSKPPLYSGNSAPALRVPHYRQYENAPDVQRSSLSSFDYRASHEQDHPGYTPDRHSSNGVESRLSCRARLDPHKDPLFPRQRPYSVSESLPYSRNNAIGGARSGDDTDSTTCQDFSLSRSYEEQLDDVLERRSLFSDSGSSKECFGDSITGWLSQPDNDGDSQVNNSVYKLIDPLKRISESGEDDIDVPQHHRSVLASDLSFTDVKLSTLSFEYCDRKTVHPQTRHLYEDCQLSCIPSSHEVVTPKFDDSSCFPETDSVFEEASSDSAENRGSTRDSTTRTQSTSDFSDQRTMSDSLNFGYATADSSPRIESPVLSQGMIKHNPTYGYTQSQSLPRRCALKMKCVEEVSTRPLSGALNLCRAKYRETGNHSAESYSQTHCGVALPYTVYRMSANQHSVSHSDPVSRSIRDDIVKRNAISEGGNAGCPEKPPRSSTSCSDRLSDAPAMGSADGSLRYRTVSGRDVGSRSSSESLVNRSISSSGRHTSDGSANQSQLQRESSQEDEVFSLPSNHSGQDCVNLQGGPKHNSKVSSHNYRNVSQIDHRNRHEKVRDRKGFSRSAPSKSMQTHSDDFMPINYKTKPSKREAELNYCEPYFSKTPVNTLHSQLTNHPMKSQPTVYAIIDADKTYAAQNLVAKLDALRQAPHELFADHPAKKDKLPKRALSLRNGGDSTDGKHGWRHLLFR